jgi:hypothetical protein
MVAHYTKRKADIREPAILIRINRLYQYGMTDTELYDATRIAWNVGRRRDDALYALGTMTFDGVGKGLEAKKVYSSGFNLECGVGIAQPVSENVDSRLGTPGANVADNLRYCLSLVRPKMRNCPPVLALPYIEHGVIGRVYVQVDVITKFPGYCRRDPREGKGMGTVLSRDGA